MSSTNPINRTTEWDDLQIKYGNYAPLPEEVKQEDLSIKAQNILSELDPLASKTLAQLDELEDHVQEDVLENYRRQRLEELRNATRKNVFGEVYEVNMSSYVADVTEASSDGQTVILHLYEDDIPACEFLNRALNTVAENHRDVKFCKAVASRVIQKYNEDPSRKHGLPTVLVYRDKKCLRQLIGLSAFCSKPEQLTPNCVEYVLGKQLKLFATDAEDPEMDRTRLGKVLRRGEKDFDEEADETADMRNTVAQDRGYGAMDLDSLMNMVRK